jgi:peptidoglycan/xylan/chitin deacetylase (PgdA/CDA1 family)
MTWKAFDILMFHSIADGPGPTRIDAPTFRSQMQAIEDCGYQGASLAEATPWLRSEKQPPPRPIVLTFDDGFTDFAETAFPEIHKRGWKATVFLPTGRMGQPASWDTWPGRNLGQVMSWQTVKELAREGIEFAAHGVSHSDLTRLPADAARAEVADSGRQIEDHLGSPVTSFAAPFGRTNAVVKAEVRRRYRAAVGTRMARVNPGSDFFELPRVEMWYFRDMNRWRSYLGGGARGYFMLRQMLRQVRALAG